MQRVVGDTWQRLKCCYTQASSGILFSLTTVNITLRKKCLISMSDNYPLMCEVMHMDALD